jgi:hypothetical protein
MMRRSVFECNNRDINTYTPETTAAEVVGDISLVGSYFLRSVISR